MLVASDDALDQYFMREPPALLERRVEAAILDHANPRVLDGHVLAAAYEGPLDDADRETLGDAALERAAHLPELKQTPAGFVWAGKDYPAARVSLRSSTPDSIAVVEEETGTLLGVGRVGTRVLDGPRRRRLPPPRRAVPRAAGSTSTGARALVSPFRGDWYTMAKQESETSILDERRRERRCGLDLCFGSVVVTERVVAYQRRRITTQEAIDLVALDLPETEFETEAVWYVPSAAQLEGFDALPRLLGSLHAAEHSMIALLPLLAMCDRWDIGGLSTNLHHQTGRPDRLRLRRARGRRRHRGTRVRASSRVGGRHGPAARRAAPASAVARRASRARSAGT